MDLVPYEATATRIEAALAEAGEVIGLAMEVAMADAIAREGLEQRAAIRVIAELEGILEILEGSAEGVLYNTRAALAPMDDQAVVGAPVVPLFSSFDLAKAKVSLQQYFSEYLDCDFQQEADGVLASNCPWHADKVSSLKIYTDEGYFRCEGGCAVGGSIIDAVMKNEATEVPLQALEWINKHYQLSLANLPQADADGEETRQADEADQARGAVPHQLDEEDTRRQGDQDETSGDQDADADGEQGEAADERGNAHY